MNTPCTQAPARPGELARLVTGGLASSGFDVSPPGHPESYRLAIAWPGARCTLAADDWGRAEWVYWPWSGADPKLAADLATTLLTGHPGPHPRLGRKHGEEGITFKGVAGLELTARGLDVQLEVYTDEDFFDARAGIVATAPGAGHDARVCVTDDGCLTWTRGHWPQATTIASDPQLYGWVTNPADVAAAVVEEVTRAMSLLRASGQGGPRPFSAQAAT